jgi:hypothetical protein
MDPLDPIFSQQFNMPPPQPKGGGMFGGDGKFGIGQAIVAGLNGYLAGTGNPVGTQNMQMMAQMAEQRRRHAQDLEDYNRKRTDDNSDWQSHYDYKLNNPEPPNNDTVADYQFILQQLGPEGAKRFLETKTNPIVMTPYGPMPYSQVNPAAPTAPVGKLTPIDGGPAPQAPGGFSY